MFGEVLRNLIRLLLLILLQALVFNHWTLVWGIQPFIYILFILMLPFETAPWVVLLLGFGSGLAMDAFENSMGMHASASVLLAYLRRPLLERLAPRDGYESGMKPTIHHMGMGWYIRYAGILTLLHHIWLLGLEFFRFDEILTVMAKGVLSATFTLVLIIIYQYLIHGSPSRGRR
jgi:rod shape-determining protein MreD